MDRAYSTFEVKSVAEDERVIEGIATTPTADRVGDIVEPKGAEFKLPLPLLWQHNAREPIGHVEHARVTDEGIHIRARVLRTSEPGRLRDRLDEAWQSIKYKLVRGLSIGFQALEREPVDPRDPWGAQHFKRWSWIELSAVTIPANQEANIAVIKRFASDELAALAAPESKPKDERDENSKGWSRWWMAEFRHKVEPHFNKLIEDGFFPMLRRVKKLETRTTSTDELLADLERRLAELEAKR